MVFAAPVWHYWIGVVIAALVAVHVVLFVALYFRKSQAPKYPRTR
jgi:hypothetical protein